MSNIGIYKITSPSGKVYIGQSWNLNHRISTYKNGGGKNQIKLFNSIQKYGWDVHKLKVVHELPKDISQYVLDEYEKLYISQYIECNILMMNIKEGGSHGKHSQETIDRMKNVTSNTAWYVKGVASKMRGKKHTEETKSKMSLSKKGKQSWFKGKKHSEKSLAMMSKSQKGKKMPPRSEEYRKNISLAHIGKRCPLLSRKVVCSVTGVVYTSIGDAAKDFNLNYSTLSSYLNGSKKNKSTLKYYNDGR